jgi:hypothetical protein
VSPSPHERFLAFSRSLPRTRPLHRQTVRVRAAYRSWFANRDLAELFAPPRSDSLTGAAVPAQLGRNGYDWRPVLSALSTPALVFHGTEDALPSWVGKELAAVIPRARLTLIPDSGHTVLGGTGDVFPRRRVIPARPNPRSRSAAVMP